MVLSQASMEMLEQEFIANCLVFISFLDNMPLTLVAS
jgi:hypothetical protein